MSLFQNIEHETVEWIFFQRHYQQHQQIQGCTAPTRKAWKTIQPCPDTTPTHPFFFGKMFLQRSNCVFTVTTTRFKFQSNFPPHRWAHCWSDTKCPWALCWDIARMIEHSYLQKRSQCFRRYQWALTRKWGLRLNGRRRFLGSTWFCRCGWSW